MGEIGKHISELLFEHDCVIVPSLGGFLASNQSARIIQPNNLIYPPYRRIAFNVYLKQNDGLLANYIVEAENIPYAVANQRLESFSSECFETLDAGRKVTITEVGTLFYDRDKNLQFEAFRNFNHLKDSFGMDAVHFLPIQNTDKKEVKKIASEKIMRPSIPAKNKDASKINLNKSKKYIGGALIVGAMAWFAVNLYLVAPKHYESTSLNPFDSDAIVLSNSDSLRNIPSTILNGNSDSNSDTVVVASVPADITTAAIDTNLIVSTNDHHSADAGITNPEIKNSPDPIEQSGNVVSASKGNVYIIAGVFKIEENAQTTLLHLQQSGFPNAQIIIANGLHYVSYDAFSGKDDALTMTDSLRRKNLEGWIWKH